MFQETDGYVKGCPTYRGTYRSHPYYCDQVQENHEVNQAFFWFCEEGGEIGVVHDIVRAKHLISAYENLSPPQHFELVEVVEGEHSPRVGNEFLGYDLSAGFNNSLLWSGMDINEDNIEFQSDETLKILRPLLHLIKIHFKSMLNSNGLFTNDKEATFCLECMMAIQKLSPGFWEWGDYEVLGLYSISSEISAAV